MRIFDLKNKQVCFSYSVKYVRDVQTSFES